jgi:tryptophan-rich sensory protein
MKKTGVFILCLLTCFGAAWLGSLATMPEIGNWYATLRKPVFNPPNWLFGPVWSILYFLMSVALYKIWLSPHPGRRKALSLFFAQLLLNVLWSYIFFRWHLLFIASVEIGLLLALIIIFILYSKPVSKIAGYCFIPYALWVSFAAVLSMSICILN